MDLVELSKDKKAVGSKRVFKNKLDKDGKVLRNKARLVVEGYSQQEGINYTEIYAPVVRLEAIHILLPFVVQGGMKLYQMD